MTAQSFRPRIVKGAFVAIPPGGGSTTTIAFQYNPSTIKRGLQPQMSGGEPQARSEAVRFTGPPVQQITIDIELNAADGLCDGDPAVVKSGMLPQLAQLELLAYPKLADVTSAQSKLASGVMEIAPQEAPRTLFVWGSTRVLPVAITQYQVTEELFDNHLNPIQANVTVTMRVLSYADVESSNIIYSDFVTYQQNLVNLAGQVQPASNADIGINPGSY